MTVRFAMAALAATLVLGGCAGRQPPPKTPQQVVHMEEIKITARRTKDGAYVFSSYDAEGLFKEATDLLNHGRCKDAIPGYQRLVDEFPTSIYASPALYNAGLCLEQLGDAAGAAAKFERIAKTMPKSPDCKDAHFQLAKLYAQLERWADGAAAADWLLAREDLSPDERLEAMARRAQALLGAGQLDDAEQQAQTALAFYRRGSSDGSVHDDTFAATADFVLAETLRQRAEAIEIPEGGVEIQRPVLEQRARFILDAQREYFNTIEFKDPRLAAASGYHIGQMYDSFWQAIMQAPVPPPTHPLSPSLMSVYQQEYRKQLAHLIEPLIRNSIRYWELTLMMVERTGVDTKWTAKIKTDLERARQRLLEQPDQDPADPSSQPAHPKTPNPPTPAASRQASELSASSP